MVLKTSIQLEQKSLVESSKTDILLSIVVIAMETLTIMNEKFKLMNSIETTTTNDSLDVTTNLPEIVNNNQIGNETLSSNLEKGKIGNETEEKSKGDIRIQILSFEKTLPSQISQLNLIAQRNTMALESKSILERLKLTVDKMVRIGIYRLDQLKAEDIQTIKDCYTQLQQQQKLIGKAAESEQIKTQQEEFGTASVQLAEKADTYITSKINLMKASKKIETLSSVMELSLERMKDLEIETDDYEKTIDYLVSCAKHLTQLKQAWGEIRDFFKKVNKMLKLVQ